VSSTIRSLIIKIGADFTEAQKTLKKASKDLKLAGKEMQALGSTLTTGLTLPIVGVGLAASKAAIDFESAFAGVTKTVDGTEAQLEGLKQGIIDMSSELPSSAVEIAAVAEAAGQLGIKTDDILGFTRTMVDLGETTNLSADQAATELARLANITGMLPENYSRLGSTIVDLGNKMATTEAEISAMALRLAGAGRQVGMTEPKILGLAAALSSVGIEAEAGGSAMSKVMANMQLAVAKGGDALQDFARVAGVSSQDFKQAYEKDATDALLMFINGLGNMEKRGEDAIVVLDDMGITEVRMRDALLRAAGAGDLFNDAIKIGTKAWEENTAMTKEAEKRYSTTESKLKILRNQIVEVGRKLGTALLPIINNGIIPAIKGFAGWLENLTNWFTKLSPATQKMTVLVAGLAAGIGPLLTVVGKATVALSTLTAHAAAASAAMAAGKGLTGAMTAFLGPAGMVTVAIAALVLIVGGLKIAYQETHKESIELQNATKELANEIESSNKAFEDQISATGNNADVAAILADELYKLNDKEVKTNSEKARMVTLIGQLNEMYPDLNLAIDEETGLLNKSRQATADLIKEKEKMLLFEIFEEKMKKILTDRVAIEEQLVEANKQVAEAWGYVNYVSGSSPEVFALANMELEKAIKVQKDLEGQLAANGDAYNTASEEYRKMADDIAAITAERLSKTGVTSYEEAYKIGSAITTGLLDGIKSKRDEALSEARNLAGSVLKAMKSTAQVQSPSKVTLGIGRYIAEGLGLGIKQKASDALREAGRLASGVLGSFRSIGTGDLQAPSMAYSPAASLTPAMAGGPSMSGGSGGSMDLYGAFVRALRDTASDRPIEAKFIVNGREFAQTIGPDMDRELSRISTNKSRGGGV
jgi:TP901 family phage tail tape measure protein